VLGGWFARNCVGGEGGFCKSRGGAQDQGGRAFAPHIRQVEVSCFWVQISSILDENSWKFDRSWHHLNSHVKNENSAVGCFSQKQNAMSIDFDLVVALALQLSRLV
jgi:hypothetical protein